MLQCIIGCRFVALWWSASLISVTASSGHTSFEVGCSTLLLKRVLKIDNIFYVWTYPGMAMFGFINATLSSAFVYWTLIYKIFIFWRSLWQFSSMISCATLVLRRSVLFRAAPVFPWAAILYFTWQCGLSCFCALFDNLLSSTCTFIRSIRH